MSELLRDVDVHGRYQNRSEAAMVVALAATNDRWYLEQLLTALLDERNEGGDWLRIRQRFRSGIRTERSDADRDRRVRKLWDKAPARLKARPPTSDRFAIHAELVPIRYTADAWPSRWGGQAGVTDRAVLAAIPEVVGESLAMMPSDSTRQLAERANGNTRQIIATSLRRLPARNARTCPPTHDGLLFLGRGARETTHGLVVPRTGVQIQRPDLPLKCDSCRGHIARLPRALAGARESTPAQARSFNDLVGLLLSRQVGVPYSNQEEALSLSA